MKSAFKNIQCIDKISGNLLCPPVLSALILPPLPHTTGNPEPPMLQENAQLGKDLVSFICTILLVQVPGFFP